MPVLRLLPLLLAVLALSVCLPRSAVAQDPTIGCLHSFGDLSATYMSGSQNGAYNMVGLESYTSTEYSILCAYRVLYRYQSDNRSYIWGNWQGMPRITLNDCKNHYATYFDSLTDWARAGVGQVSYRANNATGKNVMVAFSFGAVCSSNFICAGVCPGSDKYDESMAILRADPTYHVVPFSKAGNAPAGLYEVYSMMNGTFSINQTIQAARPGSPYPNKVITVVTSVQPCYGYQQITC